MIIKVIKYILGILPCALVAVVIAVSAAKPIAAEQPETETEYDLTKLQELLKNQDSSKEAETESETETKKKSASDAEYEDGTYYGTGTGFAGKIKVCVVVKDKKISTIEVVEVEADDAAYVERAKGVIDQVIETQSLDVDTVSGATYSSRGILEAIKNALTGAASSSTTANNASSSKEPSTTSAYEEPESGYQDGTYYGTGTGFGGTIKVKVVIADGKISTIDVVEAAGEDSSYLESAKTLIPKIIQQQSPNVDAVSGATYSSNGIINAVKDALEQAKNSSSSSKKKSSSDSSSKNSDAGNQPNSESSYTKPEAYKDGTYTAESQGFRGKMTVTVTIFGGIITNIEVESSDDEPYITNAKQLIRQIIAAQDVSGIDVITGATYSSNGIINGVKLALSQAATTAGSTETEKTGEQGTEKQTEKSTEKETEKQTESESEGGATYADGTYTGTATGYEGTITATVTIADGIITSIQLSYASASEFTWAGDGMISKILKSQSTNVDVESGATYTSNGIMNAVQQALNTAKQ